MSVTLYKDGEPLLVPPLSLHAHLGNGYFLTREESLGEEVPVEEDVEEETVADIVEDLIEKIVEKVVDEISDDVSEEDIRLVAKNLGIRPWKNMNIDKLKAKIEEKQRGDSE